MKRTIVYVCLTGILLLAACTPQEKKPENVFTVENPDFKKSPYTGMTRKHWMEAAEYLLNGAFTYIDSLDTRFDFPKQLEKTYPRGEGDARTAKLEALARTLFVAAPLLKENPELTQNGIKVADYYRHQLRSISNPESQSYIPHRAGGPSQTLLELGSLCISMQAAPEVLWNPLSQAEKDSLAATMLSYGEGPTIGSNWRFFNIFILSFLKEQGYEVNEEYLEMNLTELLKRYRGEGWYNDAPAYDYYSMWAYQTYGPFWAEMFGKKQFPELAKQFLQNQYDLVENYPYMFARDGRMNMWGRSCCYRFASVSPFPLLEYNDRSGEVNYGWLRRIASSTLLQFLQHPEFLMDNVPTMGFYGPFAPVVQIYSCRGSVYWCGKAFLGLLLPEDSPYWSATENEGPWENELKEGNVYHKFQPATNLLITNYPNCGGSEMRSWCHESVARDWQKFRSSENYNKLAYHTEFPWLADGEHGEISMNYGTLNKDSVWEVLRLYTFRSFEDEIYRRDAVLETDENVKYRLADICLPDGILRVDKVTVPQPTEISLGHYSLPLLDQPFRESRRKVDGHDVQLLSNGEYELAMIPLAGWDNVKTVHTQGLHPVSKEAAHITATGKAEDCEVYVTLQLWKKQGSFSDDELSPVRSVEVSPDKNQVTVILSDGVKKIINF